MSMSYSPICPNGTVLTYHEHPGPFVVTSDTMMEKTLLNCTELIIAPGATLTMRKCVILGAIIGREHLEDQQSSLEGGFDALDTPRIPLSLLQKDELECAFSNDPSYGYKAPFRKFEKTYNHPIDVGLPIGQKITFIDLSSINCLVVENERTLSETFLKGRIILLPNAVLKLVKSYVKGEIIQCEGSSIEKELSGVSSIITFKDHHRNDLNPLQLEILNSRLAQRV